MAKEARRGLASSVAAWASLTPPPGLKLRAFRPVIATADSVEADLHRCPEEARL